MKKKTERKKPNKLTRPSNVFHRTDAIYIEFLKCRKWPPPASSAFVTHDGPHKSLLTRITFNKRALKVKKNLHVSSVSTEKAPTAGSSRVQRYTIYLDNIGLSKSGRNVKWVTQPPARMTGVALFHTVKGSYLSESTFFGALSLVYKRRFVLWKSISSLRRLQ